SEVQVIAVPTHWPPPVQVSLKVHALPSSHAAPVLGVTVQLDVPLQVRVLHWSEVQVIAVPTHRPLPSQVSLKEQASPSSHGAPSALAGFEHSPVAGLHMPASWH